MEMCFRKMSNMEGKITPIAFVIAILLPVILIIAGLLLEGTNANPVLLFWSMVWLGNGIVFFMLAHE